VLQDNFNQDNPQSKAMLARIAELEPKAVSVKTPDLAASLAAVQAYLERRHLSADEAKAAATPAKQE
jgi:uroporphyrin-3 C-methyltransferase